MHHEQEPAFESFVDNIESSLQVVRETEALLQSMHERKVSALAGSPRAEHLNPSV